MVKGGGRDARELKAASEHLGFEFSQLMGCARKLSGFRPHSDPLVYNELITAFAIHARNLIFFFYKEPAKATDMVACHYLDDDQEAWKKVRPPMPQALDEAYSWASKFAAHLSYTRTTNKPQWPWANIADDIADVMYCFLGCADRANKIEPHLAGWYDKRLAE